MTFEKIDLPSGGWAELRDPETITVRMRRPIERVQMRLGWDSDIQSLARWQTRVAKEIEAAKQQAEDSGEEFDAAAFEPSIPAPLRQSDVSDEQLDLLSDLTDAVTVALVESWSYPAPVGMDALQDLPQKDYEALLEAASKHRDAVLPNFGVDPEKGSPTEPSGESAES